MNKRIISINAGKKAFALETIDSPNIIGPIDYALYEHELKKTHLLDPLDENTPFIFGSGPLAGSIIPGTHRLVFAGRSPLTKTFYMSTLGGAALPISKIQADFVKITGRAEKPTVLVIKNTGKLSVRFHEISKKKLHEIYTKGNKGLYSLQEYLMEKFKKSYKGMDLRILVTGPAALSTNMAGILSTLIRNGKLTPGADGWAGRGGFGSALAQGHGIVGIIYGGNCAPNKFPEDDLSNRDIVNKIFVNTIGKSMAAAALEATEKYRYSEKHKSGGTFGSNYSTSGAWTPFFNWSSTSLSTKERQQLYDKFIAGHYLPTFNKDIIDTKKWLTCGEPCPGLCKKIRKNKKHDYETYHAFGPNAGIVDLDHAEFVADALEGSGFDSIGFGTIISYVLECMYKGLLTPEDLGVKEKPNFDAETFSMKDSKAHSRIAAKLCLDVAYKRTEFANIFIHGIRHACRVLSKKYPEREQKTGISFFDLANYVPFGRDGVIEPCQYWVPGFYLPVTIQGKFLTYYDKDFHEPMNLARISMEHAVHEMFQENTGVCRFHRKWSDALIPKLIKAGYGVDVDYAKHCKLLLVRMNEYDIKAQAQPTFWETQRTKDVIHNYIKEVVSVFGASKESQKWLDFFDRTPEKAARAYWEALFLGVKEGLE